jgi:hypothetical protein
MSSSFNVDTAYTPNIHLCINPRNFLRFETRGGRARHLTQRPRKLFFPFIWDQPLYIYLFVFLSCMTFFLSLVRLSVSNGRNNSLVFYWKIACVLLLLGCTILYSKIYPSRNLVQHCEGSFEWAHFKEVNKNVERKGFHIAFDICLFNITLA